VGGGGFNKGKRRPIPSLWEEFAVLWEKCRGKSNYWLIGGEHKHRFSCKYHVLRLGGVEGRGGEKFFEVGMMLAMV